jgi:hypothetical protein
VFVIASVCIIVADAWIFEHDPSAWEHLEPLLRQRGELLIDGDDGDG